MFDEERQITKIAREVSKFTVGTMREDGVGTAEFDFIHLVRHNPGITQTQVREALHIDKGAAARRAANLEAKGYLRRENNPKDGRSQLLFATEKAEQLKNSKSFLEHIFYSWLYEGLEEKDRVEFERLLNILYLRSKAERKKNFSTLKTLVKTADRSVMNKSSDIYAPAEEESEVEDEFEI